MNDFTIPTKIVEKTTAEFYELMSAAEKFVSLANEKKKVVDDMAYIFQHALFGDEHGVFLRNEDLANLFENDGVYYVAASDAKSIELIHNLFGYWFDIDVPDRGMYRRFGNSFYKDPKTIILYGSR